MDKLIVVVEPNRPALQWRAIAESSADGSARVNVVVVSRCSRVCKRRGMRSNNCWQEIAIIRRRRN
jgi:hypothetical protein